MVQPGQVSPCRVFVYINTNTMSYFKRRWQPSKAQRKEYAIRMQAINEAKSTVPEGYPINCTGDCVTGDEITFFNPSRDSERTFGKIIKDSYGADKQQHTFTIELPHGETMLIKGRNLYKSGVYRKQWMNEQDRVKVLEDKHDRGNKARIARAERKARKDDLLRWEDGSIYDEPVE